MSVDTAILRRLHSIHRQLSELRSRLERGPQQIRICEVNCAKSQEAVEQLKEQIRRTERIAREKQRQLDEREARIEDLKGKLNACGSNREYQALQEQIAADAQANSVLSDEILETLEKIDAVQEQTRASEHNLARAEQERDKVRQRVADEASVIEADLAHVTSELEQAEKLLPGDFRGEYQRLTKVRGADALAEVDGESCGGCYQTLTPQTFNELYMSKLVLCKSCGCILYLPEGRGPG